MSIPDAIGPYTVIRELGRGGMGVVSLARDSRLDRDVAIKALPEHLAADPDRLARFEREAKTLAQLSHPNIAGILGVEEQNGARFLVLEYVEGETLADRLGRGPLPTDEAIEFACQIAQGVEAAHSASIVHRDLKPANIRITPDGVAKVLDFGLARTDEANSSTGSLDSPTMTAPPVQHSPTIPGAILGTAAYMSPEQARGRRVDKQSDVWSFGVVLYEMLAGASPFVGETAGDSLGAILHKPIDLNTLPAATPPRVRRVLERCLQRSKTDRYHSLADARLDLLEPETAPTAEPAPRRGSTARAIVIPLMLVAVAAALVGRAIPSGSPPLERVYSSIAAPDGTTIRDFKLASTGRHVVMLCRDAGVGVAGDSFRLYVRDMSERDSVVVPGSESTRDLDVAPDGGSFAFITDSEDSTNTLSLFKAPIDLSRPPVELMRVPPKFRTARSSLGWFSFAPTGEIAMLDRPGATMHFFDPGTGIETRTIAIDLDATSLGFASLGTAFDERHIRIAVGQYDPDGFRYDVTLVDIETGASTVLVEDVRVAQPIGSGELLFCRDDQIFLSQMDAGSPKIVGEFRVVEDDIRSSTSWTNGSFAVAQNGTLAYERGGVVGDQRWIGVQDYASGEITEWSSERRRFADGFAVTPDGKRVAALVEGSGSFIEIWGGDASNGRLRRLLAIPGGDVFNPEFFDNGRQVVATVWNPTDPEPGQILAFPFDGSTPPRRVWGGWSQPSAMSVSDTHPEGERALAMRNEQGTWEIIEFSLTDSEARPRVLMRSEILYEAQYWLDGIDPDQTYITYISNDAGSYQLYIRRDFGESLGPAIPVTNTGATQAAWIRSPEHGPCISYLDFDFREWIVPVSIEDDKLVLGERIARPRQLIEGTASASVSDDGRVFAIMRGPDEKYPTRLEIVQNWLQTLDE